MARTTPTAAKPPTKRTGSKSAHSHTRALIAITSVAVVIVAAAIFSSKQSDGSSGSRKEVLASQTETIEHRAWAVACSERRKSEDCAPRCGRVVWDGLVTLEDTMTLQQMASRALSHGQGAGGPSILDLHSGAMSMGKGFVDIYKLLGDKINEILTDNDWAVYKRVKETIRQSVMKEFGVSSVYLTKPTFFSKITSKKAKTEHDEYWHPHVDEKTYGSFDFTCLLYLSDHNVNFTGGEFVFRDYENGSKDLVERVVEPKFGRVSCFTSGYENEHNVNQVTSGTRFAITIAFTCDESVSIADPSGRGATTSTAVPD